MQGSDRALGVISAACGADALQGYAFCFSNVPMFGIHQPDPESSEFQSNVGPIQGRDKWRASL